METNKICDWLEAIIISNYEIMWLAYSNQVIDHMIRARERGMSHLASGISYV
jgi:hypothetical protein